MAKSAMLPKINLVISNLLDANKGLKAVIKKELADHLSGKRFIILSSLIVVTCLAALYVAASTIRTSVGQNELDFVFLKLFTTSGSSLPFSFISFVSFLGPLVGLTMGFDAINGERDRGTLSRILSQPIYRDAFINGKFISGVIVLTIAIFGLGFLVAGLGLLFFGIPPSLSEVLRIITYLITSIIYISFWLSLSILFSLLFRQSSTSALAGIAVWLFLAIFAGLLAGMVADGIYPVTDSSDVDRILANSRLKQNLSRLSPSTLYDEATTTLLNPTIRTLGPVLLQQTFGAIKGPLSFGQSLLLIWPQLIGLIAATLICFAISYIIFMRQEIRA
ncbi:MAG: type transport system permease protein [Clostridia bacterium]|jgi:ABC-2 type transport system permease protein|nr:type transport system permease protein [Clostridia bacterium]MDN5323095.1 type transport system permease protein [Clostridia bacterium]